MGTSRRPSNGATSIEAGDSGHVHVEKNQIGTLAAKFFERLLAGFRFDHAVPLRCQRGAHHAADLRFVIHDQNRWRALMFRLPAGCDRLAA